MSLLIIVSDLASITQGKCIVFIVITLLVTGRPNIRAAEAKQGKCYEGFVCENGECINGYGVCDGIANCSDGSDEIQPICINISCPANSFRCAYGACIDPSLKCNGRYDCADHSDELSSSCGLQWLTNESTPCSKDQFQCRNGECIPGTSLCDGEVNCSDRSDESILACYGGKLSNCPLGSFRCAYGGCISSAKMCDSIVDCADASDEHHLLCNRPKPQTTPRPPGRQCIVPEYDHTYFSRDDCRIGDCALRKGDAVNDNSYVLLKCHSPYVLPVLPVNLWAVKCSNGEWIPKKHTCQKKCKPLVSTSLNIDCEHNDRTVDCSEEVHVGTTAQLQCKDGYETLEGVLYHSTNKCLENGEWLYQPLHHCYYRCGILHKPEKQIVKPLIDGGKDSIAINHPWNVGLYLFHRPSNNYRMFCGGTLISPFTVLSAAHCFVNEETAERLDANNVWITLGKTNSSWSLEEDRVQRIQLENYTIPNRYAGKNVSFLNDIAVLELRTQANISRKYGIPMPACLANRTNELKRGWIGLISGWGKNHGKDSETLQAANLTFQPYEYCREHAIKTVSNDHFCSYNNEVNGSISQPTVSRGDSGSGFIYEIEGNHFIYGVTSTRTSTNYGFNLSTFTDVTSINICKFVKTTMEKINKKHSNYGFSNIHCF